MLVQPMYSQGATQSRLKKHKDYYNVAACGPLRWLRWVSGAGSLKSLSAKSHECCHECQHMPPSIIINRVVDVRPPLIRKHVHYQR